MARKRKLTDEQIEQVRAKFREGHTGKSIAAFYGISILTAYNIKNRKGNYVEVPEAVLQATPILNGHGEIIGLNIPAEAVLEPSNSEGQEA